MNTSTFSFYGVMAVVDSACAELHARLSRDFSHFAVAPGAARVENPLYRFQAILGPIPVSESLVKERAGRRTRRTKNAILYDQGAVRICDYYGEALTIYDFKANTAAIHAPTLDRLHEVTYLAILSRVGKRLDLSGLHRVHAMGVHWKGVCALCLMPMHGGKTTLFMHLLRNSEAEIISDDSPLVTHDGTIRSFPLRVGLTEQSVASYSAFANVDLGKCYTLDRMKYGRKVLLPINAFDNAVFDAANTLHDTSAPVILLRGFRGDGQRCVIRRTSLMKIYPALVRNLVIGEGLPIMREYFLESQWRDISLIARILIARIKASLRLGWKAEKYEVWLGADSEDNARAVEALISGQRPGRRETPSHT